MKELKELEAAAIAAGEAAGRVIEESRPAGVRFKGKIDLVTEVDLRAESVIRETLERLTPGIAILAEEGGGARDARTRWIVDPLDGTTNFVHGFPFYCVSIALELDGELACGVIRDPVRGVTYSATRGGGATANGEPLRVSSTSNLNEALLASGFAYDRRERADFYLRYVKAFMERAQGFRRCGSAAMDLVMVARGELDGYWEFGLNPWDVAAGALLVSEAGGRVSEMNCAPLDLEKPKILATNSLIHEEMAGIIRELEGAI